MVRAAAKPAAGLAAYVMAEGSVSMTPTGEVGKWIAASRDNRPAMATSIWAGANGWWGDKGSFNLAGAKSTESAGDYNPRREIKADQGYWASMGAIAGSDSSFADKFDMALGRTAYDFKDSEFWQGVVQTVGSEYWQGAVQTAVGVGEMSLASYAATFIGPYAAPFALHGLDDVMTGLSRVGTGKSADTSTFRGVEFLTGSRRIARGVDSFFPLLAAIVPGVAAVANWANMGMRIGFGSAASSVSARVGSSRAGDVARSTALDLSNGANKVLSSLDDFNTIKGSGANVGDLQGMSGKTVEDIVRNIPENATMRKLTPAEGGSQVGLEYKWVDENGVTNRLRVHDPDPSAGAGANSSEGWTGRWQSGRKYYDPIEGNFRHANVHKEASPFYDPAAANNTHIPVKTPEQWLIDLMKSKGTGK